MLDPVTLQVTDPGRDNSRAPATRSEKHAHKAKSRAPAAYQKATIVNRVFATFRHFAGYVQARRDFPAGNSTAGIRELVTDERSWKGLSDTEVLRLKSSRRGAAYMRGKEEVGLDRRKALPAGVGNFPSPTDLIRVTVEIIRRPGQALL